MVKKLKININGVDKYKKDFYKSLTIQSAIATILIVVGTSLKGGVFGLEEILIVVGCLGAIYGRIKAKKELK